MPAADVPPCVLDEGRPQRHHEALGAALERRRPGRIRPSLERIRAALAELNNPQHSFRSILVVGTNGKGSTAVMAAEILAATKVKVGLYTSPHLFRVTERIRVEGRDIDPLRLVEILAALDDFPELTYFEVLTVAAFLEFRDRSVDVAVLEAGLGGRWDATRTAGSEIAGLTNIGSDHRKWLGDTRSDIAADKGAALAAAAVAVRGPGVATDVIESLGAPESRPASDWVNLEPSHDDGVAMAQWQGSGEVRLELPLAGHHQLENLHLALALVVAARNRGWCHDLRPDTVRRGLARVSWPGRCSSFDVGGRTLLLDGAHNLEGCRALAYHLQALGRKYHLVFSCLDDKPVEDMAEVLKPVVAEVAVFELEDDRAMPLDRLANAFEAVFVAESASAALAALPDPVVAAGSLRLAEALSMSGG